MSELLLLAGQFCMCACMAWLFVRRQVRTELDALQAKLKDHTEVLKNHGTVLAGHEQDLHRMKQARTKVALGG